MTMIFMPPTTAGVDSTYKGTDSYRPVTHQGQKLFRFYGLRAAGLSVLKVAEGVYKTVQTPTQDDIDAAVTAYIGGHRYVVSDAEGAALMAAGYDVTAATWASVSANYGSWNDLRDSNSKWDDLLV